jgi:thioester reductase-like protein
MPYLFLTGATGLLGRYLIKDLSVAGMSLAVLVRASRKASAWHRVETVMCYWEKVLGRSLPRPVVLEGDISEPDLGLDARGMRWVAENCDLLVHNAASLTFQATGPASEPWRSNVTGTRQVLDLCRNARIRNFQHVSTAYVCGQRSGRIYEADVDVGQKPSNDYEQSKLQAELMVRSADFLDSVTVHRPAIIIGDSQTGYTTTYHGFYALLQAIATIAHTFNPDLSGHASVIANFGATGRETKNLVPVDWVSAVMAHVIAHPQHHGQTYHLTPQHPIPTRLIADICEEVIGFYGVKFGGSDKPKLGATEYEQLFSELISVYNSYWKDDPTFDATNTRAAAPHLPCPHVDRRLLRKLSEYAIRVNFTSPRAKPISPPFDVSAALEPLLDTNEENTVPDDATRLGLRVTGHGGGDWTLIVAGDDVVAADLGVNPRAAIVITCQVDQFAALLSRQADVDQALDDDSVTVAGDSRFRQQAIAALRQLSELSSARAMASQ